MYPIYFLVISIIGSIGQIIIAHTPIAETLLLWLLICNVGLQGLFTFIGHFFVSDIVAQNIGWPIGNPFQIELSFTSLAFGVLGILCIWLRGNFWLAVIIGRTIFSWGCAYTHIIDIKKRKNKSIYNAGPVLYLGIVLPIIMIILLVLL